MTRRRTRRQCKGKVASGLLAALLSTATAAAWAQDKIPAEQLRNSYESCTETCENENSYSYCSAMCACMARQMDLHWTVEEFRERYEALGDPQEGPFTRGELGRIASYCRERTE